MTTVTQWAHDAGASRPHRERACECAAPEPRPFGELLRAGFCRWCGCPIRLVEVEVEPSWQVDTALVQRAGREPHDALEHVINEISDAHGGCEVDVKRYEVWAHGDHLWGVELVWRRKEGEA